jgi:hypothetical protein
MEREGALFVALLFLLNFCSGPIEDSSPVAHISQIIYEDTFNVSQGPASGLCMTDISDVLTDASLPFGQRELLHGDLLSSTSQLTMDVSSGKLSFMVTGLDLCLPTLHAPSIALAASASVDHSAVSKAIIEVSSGGSGGVTLCVLGELSDVSTTRGSRAWAVNIDPSIPNTFTIGNPTTTSVDFDATNVQVVVFQCEMRNNTVIIFERIAFES